MAAEKRAVKAKKKKGKAKHSFILTLLLVLAVGYFTISLIDTQLKIKEREKTAEQVSAQYEQQLAENERLQKVADGGSQEDISNVLHAKNSDTLCLMKRYTMILHRATERLAHGRIKFFYGRSRGNT